MGKLALLFAGQGAQAPGMGYSLYQLGGEAAQVFEATEAARPGTKADCFEGTKERLAVTEVTQPCVFTVDMAAAAALGAAGLRPDGVAGFSLGELAALTFAGAFPLSEGLRLVCRRGAVMQDAAEKNPGAMAAVMKLEDARVEALCQGFEGLWPVNYNCPGQLVVAGKAEKLDDFCAAVKAAGGLAKRLPVGGAFHTPLMEAASMAFSRELDDSEMAPPALPVYANLTALPYEEPMLRATLAAQIQRPVRFAQSLRAMAEDGFDRFVEVGPGKALSGFVKRTLPDATVLNVQDAESLQTTLDALKA